MGSHSDKVRADDAVDRLTKRVKDLEVAISKLASVNELRGQQHIELMDKFEQLLLQLNRHVNPTREEVWLLKRTNRELSRELQKVHGLLAETVGEVK